MIERLDVAVRAWTKPAREDPPAESRGKRRRRRNLGPSEWSLTFDTETLTTLGMGLRVGAFQVRRGGRLTASGLFYEPNTITSAELAQIKAFADTERLQVLTRTEFIARVFFTVVCDKRGLLVGCNLPFDVARIAIAHDSARSRDKKMRGGFTFLLSANPKRPRIQIKRIGARGAFIQLTIPEGKEPERQNRKKGGDVASHRGYFVDVTTIGAALLTKKLSLKSLADLLETKHRKLDVDEHGGELTTDYLAYALNDVQVTWECYEKLRDRYEGYNLESTPLYRIYSEASIGKAHKTEMNLRPWSQEDFPDWLKAALMESYYGGRAECSIRRTPVPGVYVDFAAQYPTSFTLQDLWRFEIAERIEGREEDPAATQALLDTVSIEDVLSADFWPRLNMVVCVQPDGDRLPTRARYRSLPGSAADGDASSARNVGLVLRSGGPPQWYTLADCVASKLETGRAPRVLRAVSFHAHGRQKGLKPLCVAGDQRYRIDPYGSSFIKRLVELRATVKAEQRAAERNADHDTAVRLDAAQLAMKITGNANAYGNAVEMNVIEHRKPIEVTCYRPDGSEYVSKVTRSEETVKWFNPLVATLVAAGGRLLLAAAMRLVRDCGGVYAFCDTDSLFVVATRDGGLIACEGGRENLPDGSPAVHGLSWAEVKEIADRFASLNPYDPAAVPGSILEVEDENTDPVSGEQRTIECFSIAAKRYALFVRDTDGRPIVVSRGDERKRSEHGLGHLLSPNRDADTDGQAWKDEWWRHLLAVELGFASEPPAWFAQMAEGRITVTSPHEEKLFREFNCGLPYHEQVRPWNFLNTLHLHPSERTRHFGSLIAPAEQNAAKRATRVWLDRSGRSTCPQTPRVGNSSYVIPGTVLVQSYGNYFEEFRSHTEAKALAPDGKPCKPWTKGLLRPRHVETVRFARVGKESNPLAEHPDLPTDRDNRSLDYPEPTCRGCDKPLKKRAWCDEACRKRTGRSSDRVRHLSDALTVG